MIVQTAAKTIHKAIFVMLITTTSRVKIIFKDGLLIMEEPVSVVWAEVVWAGVVGTGVEPTAVT